jgi:Glycosyl hydrolases family 18
MSRKRWGASALRAGALSIAALSITAGVVASPAQAHSEGARTVGYYTQWSIYDRNVPLRDLVDSGVAAKLTTLNYAFGFLDEQGRCVSSDPWADWQRPFPAGQSVNGKADEAGQALAGNLNQLKQLKKKYPKLRVNISLGGWTGSKYFSNAAFTPESRAAHVKSCIDLWLKGNLPQDGGTGAAAGVFDGFDLDWEWPGSAGNTGNVIRPEDKQNFTKLLVEYRVQLARLGLWTRKSYDLTAFLPANPVALDAGFETAKVFKLLTFATIQGYDQGRFQLADRGRRGAVPGCAARQGRARCAVLRSRLDRRGQPEQRVVPAGHGCRVGELRGRHGGLQEAEGTRRLRCLQGVPGRARRPRLDFRRLHVLDLRRPDRDEAQGALHQRPWPGRRHDLVTGRRHCQR